MATIKQTGEGFEVYDDLGKLTICYMHNYTHAEACLIDAQGFADYYTEYPRAEVWKYKPAHLTA